MASTYKLTYFNFRGRAEPLRFILAQAGIAYEDKRVEGEEWSKVKPATPTGHLPTLEVEGKVLFGSLPIARFLAERFGLAGANDLENAQLGGYMDLLIDFLQKIYPWRYETDETKKAAIWDTIRNEHIPHYWGLISKWIESNSSDDGWIFGNNPTYIDFYIYCYTELITAVDSEAFKEFPAVLKNRAAVESLPNIAKWIKERPVTA